MSYVYFGKHQQTSLIKIGLSKNPTHRLRELNVIPLGVIHGNRETEQEIHQKFSALRVPDKSHGLQGMEWFMGSHELMSFIASTCLPVSEIPASPSTYVRKIVTALPKNSNLMNVKELAKALQVSKKTIYLLLKRGELPALRVGYAWRFRKEDIRKYLGHGKAEVPESGKPEETKDVLE